MQYTHEHLEIQKTLRRFIDEEINPHVDEWEAAESFPAHEVFEKLGALGLLGLNKPEDYGGAGLDYSYAMAMAEALGHVCCGGVPMAIGVQTDMCTPALARFGSDALRREFLAPGHRGPDGGLHRRERARRRQRRGRPQEPRAQGRRRLPHQRPEDVDHQQPAGRLDVHAGQHRRRAGRAWTFIATSRWSSFRWTAPASRRRKKIRKIGMHSSDTGLIYFDEVRVPQRYRIGEEGQGFVYQMQQFQEERLWCAASSLEPLEDCIAETIEWAQERQPLRRHAGRPAVGAIQAGRAARPRWRRCAP